LAFLEQVGPNNWPEGPTNWQQEVSAVQYNIAQIQQQMQANGCG